MPYYCLSCPLCGREDEVRCQYEDLETKRPQCCGQGMVRDYRREHFQGITYRSKGVYGGGFVEDFGDGRPVEITDYQQHSRELAKRNLHFHEMSAVHKYHRKHIKDTVPKEERR